MMKIIAAVTCTLLLALPSLSAPPDSSPPEETAVPKDRPVIDRALSWLAERQQENGSWICKIGYKLTEQYEGEEGEHVGVTALAGMAYLGAGHTPGRGKHGRTVERALQFVLDSIREEDGYISRHGSRMYSHAFATMFLAEIQGMSRRDDVSNGLRRAVDLLVTSQSPNGGWRYSPTPIDTDLSVTVSSLQALRAARNTGISVPVRTIEKAVEYVRSCHSPIGFRYQSPVGSFSRSDTRITYPLTACGIVSLHSAGIYKDRQVREGIRVLQRRWSEITWGKYHYFYGHYYASQAMYTAGGDDWSRYFTRVRAEILRHRNENGYWVDDVGDTYATAMACIILQIPCELLPIFQK